MGRTTIDIVKLTFALAENTKSVTQEAINQVKQIEEAGEGIKLSIDDSTVQEQVQHILSMLKSTLKGIDLGSLTTDLVTGFLDFDRSFEQNNKSIEQFYNRLVSISNLPEEMREKLSGLHNIDWNSIFAIDTEDLQASKESIEDYVISEEEAIKELNKLLEERNALQDQIEQKQKKLDANASGKKYISQKEQNELKKEIEAAKSQLKYNELDELKYFTRIRSLNSSLTDNQFSDHLDKTNLIADENDIKRYNEVISRAFEESNTAITEHIEALRSIKDISDFDDWYKLKHITQNLDNYLNSVDNKKVGEHLERSVSNNGVGLSLDVSDEEIAKFISEIQSKIDASKGIKLKIQVDKIVSDIESALKNHEFVTDLKGKATNNTIKPTDILSVLSGWNTADSIFINKNKTFANYRERGMAFNSQNGELTNPYTYSGHGEYNMNTEILDEYKATHKDIKDLKGVFDSWIHTHPSNKAAFSGQDYASMAAKRDTYGVNHHYVMGKDEIQYLNITDVSTSDLNELSQLIKQAPKEYLDIHKDEENKFYSGKNFENFLQAEGTFEKATANLASFLQKFSKQLLPLITNNVSAKGKVGDLVTNYDKSRDLAKSILESTFSDTSLQGSHNYIDSSIFKKAIANYFWKAIGLEEGSFSNLNFSSAIQADENRAITEFLRFRTVKPSEKQRYMPDDAINAINEYAYNMAYNYLKNLKNEQGFNKYNVDDIMKKFSVEDFVKNNPMGLSTSMMKTIKGALQNEQNNSQDKVKTQEIDGYKKLEQSLTPLKDSIDKLSSNLESVKNPLEQLSSTLSPVFENINSSGILNNQAEPSANDVENIKERIKKAIEEEKYHLSLEISDEEINNFINSISSKINSTKGITLKINTENIIQQIKDSLKGQKIETEIVANNGNQAIEESNVAKFDDSILNRPVDFSKNKNYINKYFNENKAQKALQFTGEIFKNYLQSDKNYTNFSSELAKYLGPKLLESLVKMNVTSPETLKKLKELEDPNVMNNLIGKAFDKSRIKGEKNYTNSEKYNESILKTIFRYLGINTNKGRSVKADLLTAINNDQSSPLNNAVSNFAQLNDKFSLYPKELIDALTRYVNQCIEIDKEKSKPKAEKDSKNIPWSKNPRNPDSKNFDPNTIPVNKRDEINAKRVSNGLQPYTFTDTKKEESNTVQSQPQKDNVEDSALKSNISELKNAISENTTAVNRLSGAIEGVNNNIDAKSNTKNTNVETDNTKDSNTPEQQKEVTKAVEETTAELEHQNDLRNESLSATAEQVEIQKEVTKETEKSAEASTNTNLDTEEDKLKEIKTEQKDTSNNKERNKTSEDNERKEISEQIISSYKELETLQIQLQDLYLNNAEESAINEQIAKINEKKSAIQDLLSKVSELNEAEKSAINNYNSEKFDLSSKNNYANDFIKDKLNNYENIANTLLSSGFNGQTAELEERINAINKLIDEVRAKDGLDITNKDDIDYLNNIENKINNILGEINDADNSDLFNVANSSSVFRELASFSNYISKNSKARGLFGDRINSLQAQANSIGASPNKVSIQRLKDFRNEFNKLKMDISAKGVGGISFFDRIAERLKETGAYFASFVSVYQIIGIIKQAGATVLDLNTKLVELSKVSDTSIADLEHQFDSFSNISKEIGGTVSDTIQATADWSRNGYNLPDSKELARVAQIYKNVGDGIDINQANESLISTLRGYNLEAKDALSIVDKINSVANTQPIDSGGLGEALQRSAASFQAANTSLSESIALITASNAVVQNPDRVGNMWKTVSARIRGASAELQEMGEDTDNMVESTSKLRDLVKGMTGFDIMKDEDTFKSIYEIIVGIGEKWKDLSDIQQASLLEKLAGKVQSNALAAALNNVDLLKEAYQTAEESAGSAMAEQERFSQGLQYHLNQFNQARESLSHNLINSDLLKFFVDLGTVGVEAIDKITQAIGGLSIVISSIMVIGGLKTKNGGPLLYFTELGKQITSLIHTFSASAGLTGLTSFIEGLGSLGTTALGVGGILAISAAITAGYKAYDNYVNKYQKSVDKMTKANSSITNQTKEIEELTNEYNTIQGQLEAINSIDGAKLAKDGEKEKLQEQSAELERQIALKKASLKLDAKDAYDASKDVMNSTVVAHDNIDIEAMRAGQTRREYMSSNDMGYYGSPRLKLQNAVPAEIKYYKEALKQRQDLYDQIDKLSRNEKGEYDEKVIKNNADAINELNKQLNTNQETIDSSKNSLIEWSNSLNDAADSAKFYAEYGHFLDEDDQATIAFAESTKKSVDALMEQEDALNNVASSQEKASRSYIKSAEQLKTQKDAVDNLISSYKELYELASKGDGLDIALDDEQLKKYGNALEYVNGVYKLNTEKLFAEAEKKNQEKIIELQKDKEKASLHYLQNVKDIAFLEEKLANGEAKLADGTSIKKRIADLKSYNEVVLEQNKVLNYQISQLENVTSNYQKWLAVSGQDLDAKTFTGVQDASKSILDIIGKGQLGTDKYKMAVDFVIPDGIDREDTTAVKKYIEKNIKPYFTEDATGVRKFLKEASTEEKGIFDYNSKTGDYTLKNGMTTEKIMERMGWSEDVVRAMFDQLKTYNFDFEWDVEGLHSSEERLMHLNATLEELNKQKKELEEEGSDKNEEKIEELNDKIKETTHSMAQLNAKMREQTTTKIDKAIEESGGAKQLLQEINWEEEKGVDKSTIGQNIAKKLNIQTQIEVDLYTQKAEQKIGYLKRDIKQLEEDFSSGKISKTRYETQLNKKKGELEETQSTLEILHKIDLKDSGMATEKTVNSINTMLGEIKGLLQTISTAIGKLKPEEKKDDNSGNKNKNNNGDNPSSTTGVKSNGSSGRSKAPVVNSNDFGGELPKGMQDTHVTYTIEVDASQAKQEMGDTQNAAKGVSEAVNNIPSQHSIQINDNFTAAQSRAIALGNTITSVIKKLQELNAQQPSGGTTTGGGGGGPTRGDGGVKAKGNAFARGNDIVGEQGRELVVDPHKGIWYTVGNSGTEMINLPKDAIIYSHNQTEALLKSGVTSRGKSTGRSFADGNQQYVFGNVDLHHRQPYYWDDGAVSTVLGASWGMDGLSFAVATLLQGNDVRPLGNGEIEWYLEQLVSRSHDPNEILALDRQGFTDPAGNWLHDLIAYVGTDGAYAEYVASIMHVISDEYERSIGTYARGNAFANGTLVGERGRELVVDPNTGRWYTVGDNGSEMINLPKDAIVYNHQQTENLLKNGHTSRGHSTGASFVSGNAYAPGDGISGGGNNSVFKNITTTSKDAAKSAEKAAKSAEKAAKNAKKDADEAKETIDWIERALEYQNREIKKWKDVMDDDYEPYSNRFKALGEYKEQLLEQEEVLTEALNRRNEKFEEDSKKLTDAIGEEKASVIIERVLKGDVDPGEWLQKFQEEFGAESGEKIYKIVVDLQTDQKNIESTKDDIYENGKAIRDAIQEAYKMQLNIIKAAKDDLDYEMDVLEHNLDMKDVLGKMVVEADYQEMIDLTDDMVDNLQEQKATLEEQLDTLEEGSQEWYNCKQEINSVNKELMECEKNQAEWNDKIMRLPIERLDKYLGMLDNIKKDLSNWVSERDTLGITTLNKTIGQQFEIITKQIAKYNEQIDKYRELISNYEYGSDKFEEAANAIQGIEDNVSSLIQEMEELNMQFLKLPIDEITKANEKLQNINSAEQRVLDDYDTALSAVLSLFDKQIDRLNDDKDYWDEYYEKLIKPEQEKLDLLNEQNEAKQIQYNIDKAQYDLDKARQQKNVQVVRNGRIEYDSDLDAIKNASDALKDAELDKVKYDIQQVIDGYEKLNEKKQEELDDEIEAYDDARNRWQTFEDERTFEKESAEAERLFGKGWENAIISRNDDREYDIFSKGHIELDRQITANEKQIEANERMIDLMTRYADAFLSGEMTYEEAVAQYTKLYNDYQSGGALVSQESLAAELAFNNAKTMAEALTGNNKTTKEQYDIFLKQLEKSNDYKAVYEPLQKNWADMAMNIEAQLKELEELARLAEEIASNTRSGRGSSDDDDDDGGRGEWSRNPTGYGAGTKYNPNGTGTLYVSDSDNPGGISKSTYGTTGKYFDAESGTFKSYVSGSSITSKIKDAVSGIISSYNSSGGGSDRDVNVESRGSTTVEAKSVEVKSDSKPSGPASDPEYTSRGKGPHAFADGLAGGMIGNLPATEKFKKLQAMGLKPLDPDEVPAFLHVGEGVVNAIQQGNILQSVANAFKSGVASAIPADAVRSVENNYHIDCTFGDFNLPGVQDVNGFADAMKNNFESIMNQQFSKMF